jgi:hypothetical protein
MDRTEFNKMCEQRVDRWLPACGGTEQPFRSRSGVMLLYCYNPALGRHAWLNVGTDMVLPDDEAMALMGN